MRVVPTASLLVGARAARALAAQNLSFLGYSAQLLKCPSLLHCQPGRAYPFGSQVIVVGSNTVSLVVVDAMPAVLVRDDLLPADSSLLGRARAHTHTHTHTLERCIFDAAAEFVGLAFCTKNARTPSIDLEVTCALLSCRNCAVLYQWELTNVPIGVNSWVNDWFVSVHQRFRVWEHALCVARLRWGRRWLGWRRRRRVRA